MFEGAGPPLTQKGLGDLSKQLNVPFFDSNNPDISNRVPADHGVRGAPQYLRARAFKLDRKEFITAAKLDKQLRAKDWVGFAFHYNGTEFQKNCLQTVADFSDAIRVGEDQSVFRRARASGNSIWQRNIRRRIGRLFGENIPIFVGLRAVSKKEIAMPVLPYRNSNQRCKHPVRKVRQSPKSPKAVGRLNDLCQHSGTSSPSGGESLGSFGQP